MHSSSVGALLGASGLLGNPVGETHIAGYNSVQRTSVVLVGASNVSDTSPILPSQIHTTWQYFDGTSWINFGTMDSDVLTPTGAAIGAQLRFAATYTDLSGDHVIGSAEHALVGTGARDTLTGDSESTGNIDYLFGLGGNDTYYVHGTGDIVVEASEQGVDTVHASIDYQLTACVENLILEGSAINGIGNGWANTITGTDADNMINGRAGADRMIGGDGNDRYFVDNINDVVTELADEGIDNVSTSVSYTLGDNIENLRATANAQGITLTGNALNNQITGGIGDDVLIGGGGRDVLTGGQGADTFRFLSTGDSPYGSGPNYDVIRDFDAAEHDVIDISDIYGGALNYIGDAAFSGAAGEIRVVDVAGGQRIDVNIDADLQPEIRILVRNGGITGIDDFVH